MQSEKGACAAAAEAGGRAKSKSNLPTPRARHYQLQGHPQRAYVDAPQLFCFLVFTGEGVKEARPASLKLEGSPCPFEPCGLCGPKRRA